MHVGERLVPNLVGQWQDRYIYADGREVVTPWQRNQIQNTASSLVAGLLKSEYVGTPTFLAPRWLAIGSGLVGWDTVPPVQSVADVALTTEYYRKIVDPVDALWMDDFTSNGGVVVAGPTRFVALSVTLLPADANGAMREFGLFGGLATAAADSGLMFNWIVHPKIDKDSSFTIVRTIEIEVALP